METIVKELQEKIWNLSFKISYNASLLKENYYTEADKEELRAENLRLTHEMAECKTLLLIFKQKSLN